jgi:tRNA pseudouridine55 synthase
VDGVLVVDKPAGMTSHDVVDEVRRRLRTKRVGHGGTLDPGATGVLVLGVGKATKLLRYAQASPKRYRTTARFGTSTTTQDASGEVLEQHPPSITAADVSVALKGFVGEIDQMPPMVSAVKVGGERLYRKALRGEEVERAARRVTVYSLELVEFIEEGPTGAPEATLDVSCSAGTYVRTLVHDLGAVLECGAHLISLRRTAAGGWNEDDAISLDSVGAGDLLPLTEAVRDLPVLDVDETAVSLIANGRPLDSPPDAPDGALVAVLHAGDLLAVYRKRGPNLVADRVVPR